MTLIQELEEVKERQKYISEKLSELRELTYPMDVKPSPHNYQLAAQQRQPGIFFDASNLFKYTFTNP